MSESVRSRYFVDRIRFGVEKRSKNVFWGFSGFGRGVKSIPPSIPPRGDSLFRLRTGGSRVMTVSWPKICSKVIFYIPEHPRTLSKRFGTFRGRQRTFKSHFYNFFENYDFLCIFPLHHPKGITQELHRNWV